MKASLIQQIPPQHEPQKKMKTSFPFPLPHHLISEVQVYELLNWWVICPFKLSNCASEDSCHLLFMSMSCMAGLPQSALATGAHAIQNHQINYSRRCVLHRHPVIDNKTCLLSVLIWQQQPTLPARTGVCHKSIAILSRRKVLGSHSSRAHCFQN